jgi:hypothetical protein
MADKHKNIMIDLTSHPHKRYNVNICHYCNHDKYPNGKVIDPTADHNAKQMKDGSFKCGVCVTEGLLRLMKG